MGKWKLDVSRSTIVDQMAIESAGPNKYTFRFEGGPPETILADGTDQPGLPGTTLSIKIADSRTLKVVRKKAGRVVVSANWKLSRDGQTLHDAFEGTQPDGSTISTAYLYRRVSGAAGFSGNWESTTPSLGLKFELQIRPYRGEGLSFLSLGSVKNVIFDGHEHAVADTGDDVTASGRRQSERVLEFTEKTAGTSSTEDR